MYFSVGIEDETYYCLSIFVIGLYLLGTLRISWGIFLVLVRRLFWDVLFPIYLILSHILHKEPTEPKIPRDNPTYPKKASPKLQLRPLPGQAYELNQET